MSKRKTTAVVISIDVSSLDLVQAALSSASFRKGDMAEKYFALGDEHGYEVMKSEQRKIDCVLVRIMQKKRRLSSLV